MPQRLDHIGVTPKGVRPTGEPRGTGPNLSIWTVPETSGGVQFQFMQKGAVKPEETAS